MGKKLDLLLMVISRYLLQQCWSQEDMQQLHSIVML